MWKLWREKLHLLLPEPETLGEEGGDPPIFEGQKHLSIIREEDHKLASIFPVNQIHSDTQCQVSYQSFPLYAVKSFSSSPGEAATLSSPRGLFRRSSERWRSVDGCRLKLVILSR